MWFKFLSICHSAVLLTSIRLRETLVSAKKLIPQGKKIVISRRTFWYKAIATNTFSAVK